MPLLLSACLGLIPMLLFAVYVNWLDRYEKEPKWLLVSTFLWGAVIASTLAFVINTLTGLGMYLLTASEALADLSTSVFIAPLVEESLKGMALLGLFFAFHSEFDSLLDGAVYGGMIGLGFGATENFYYVYAHGYQEEGWAGLWGVAFIRIVLIGWQHAFYTAFSGIGLARARLSRSSFLRLFFALGGFTLAVLTHALHNALASLAGWWTVLLDWAGWAGMLVLILLFIQQEQRLLKKHLQEEVELGTLSASQYFTAISSLAQAQASWNALANKNLRQTRRFYQLCAELAHKKEQLERVGEEQGNSRIIAELREELKRLSEQVSTAER